MYSSAYLLRMEWRPRSTSSQDEIDRFYSSEVYPLLTSVNLRPTLAGFLHAYSLVCSRAFLVDAYHGLSMVPVADA